MRAFRSIEQDGCVDLGFGIGCERVQQRAQMLHQPRRGRRFEQLPIVFENAMQSVIQVPGIEDQVEQRGCAFGGNGIDRQAGEGCPFGRRVLQREHHLEQWTATEIALGLELIDEPLERQVLVRVCSERHALHACDEVRKARQVMQVDAQCQRVDEETDQSFGLGAITTGDR